MSAAASSSNSRGGGGTFEMTRTTGSGVTAAAPPALPEVTYMSMNQDNSCVCVATRQGFSIFSAETFRKIYSEFSFGGVSIAEMLLCTSLVALVGLGPSTTEDEPGSSENSQRQLTLWNTTKRESIMNVKFRTAVLALRLNTKRLVAVLRRHVHIFNLQSMKLLHSVDRGDPLSGASSLLYSPPSQSPGSAGESLLATQQTASGGPTAAAAASRDELENSVHVVALACTLGPQGAQGGEGLLAFGYFPAAGKSDELGCVLLMNSFTLEVVGNVVAHKSPLSALQFSPSQGRLLASAGAKGTIVRLFDTASLQTVAVYRRGSSDALIRCLEFSTCSRYLSVAGSSETVHIFAVPAKYHRQVATAASVQEGVEVGGGGGPPLRSSPRVVEDLAGGNDGGGGVGGLLRLLLPTQCRDMVEAVRSFAYVRLRLPPKAWTLCTVLNRDSSGGSGGLTSPPAYELMALSSQGYAYLYDIDAVRGGEARLKAEHSFLRRYMFLRMTD